MATIHKNFKFQNVYNRFNLFYAYLTKKSIIKGLPNIFIIETTNDCNKNCLVCVHKNMTRPVGYMDFELFKEIIDQIYLSELVFPFFLGESLLHKDIYKMISYCKQKKLFCSLFTNGTLLNDEESRNIISSGLDHLQISLNAVEEPIYKDIDPSCTFRFEQTIENIDRFLAINKRAVLTTISILSIEANNKKWEETISYWKRKGIDVRFKPFVDWNSNDESIKKFGKPIECKRNQVFPCDWLWRQFHILWDGRVVPCCFDYDGEYILGDVTNNSIREIWNNEKYAGLRGAHLKNNKKISLCEKCRRRKISMMEIPFLILTGAFTALNLRLSYEKKPNFLGNKIHGTDKTY